MYENKFQVHRLHKIFKYAKEQNVRVMVDAEQSYFQPAIHRLEVLAWFQTGSNHLIQAYHGADADLQHGQSNCVQHVPVLLEESSQDHHSWSWTGAPPK